MVAVCKNRKNLVLILFLGIYHIQHHLPRWFLEGLLTSRVDWRCRARLHTLSV